MNIPGDDHKEINLLTAQPRGEMLEVVMTIDGRTEKFVIARHTAASAIGYLAGALSKKS